MANKKWFSARLVFVSLIDGHRDADPLCEESIIVVQEEDEEKARLVADGAAKSMEHYYKNDDGQTVAWKLAGVLEVQDLCEPTLSSGTEVFSRMFSKSHVELADVRELLDSLEMREHELVVSGKSS